MMMDEEKQPENSQEIYQQMMDSAETPQPLENANPGSSEPNQDAISGDAIATDASAEATLQDAAPSQEDVLNFDSGSSEDMGGIDYRVAITELTRQMESLKAQLEDRNTQYMRMAADFDNFRKRTQREKEELEQQVKCSTVVEILPVVDNFERARTQLKPQTDSEMNLHKSYQGVYRDLVERLKRIGVSPMRSEGKEFDPNLHEAVMRESTEEFPEGTVMEELVRGYLLGERVLRHAMVKVAAAPEPVVASEESHQGDTTE